MEIHEVLAEEIAALTQEAGQSEHIKELSSRVKRCCCSYCGSPLMLKRISSGLIDDARVEIFCPWCNRIEFGVEPEIFRAAQYYVTELKFDYYPDLDDNEVKNRMNIAKANEIMQWCCKNLGILDKDGFVQPIDMDATLLGQDLCLSETELQRL